MSIVVCIALSTLNLILCSVEVDLVFLHGLRGGPFRTWRSRRETSTETSSTDCWPRVGYDFNLRFIQCLVRAQLGEAFLNITTQDV